MKILWGVVAAVALLVVSFGLTFMGSYNGLVAGNQQIDQSWAQVETQYQRRFDLVPNLVAATKGAMKQEQTVFNDIAQARTHYAGAAPGSDDQVQATGQYEGALSRLLVVMENYPTLKSLDNVRALTDELAGTENRVAVVRDRYNADVTTWNTKVSRFPTNIIAGMFGFAKRPFFKADVGASTAPTVDLSV